MNGKFLLYSMLTRVKGYHINKYLKELSDSQYFTKKELEEVQTRKLIHLISHAYQNVPYYRRVMNERDLRPIHIQSKSDLSKLPILTKDIIRKNYNDMISIDKRKYVISKTGGSTGEPLSFHLDIDSVSFGKAANLRGMGWAGYRFGDKTIVIAGSSLGISNEKEGIKTKIIRKIANKIPLPAIHLDNSIISKYCKQINSSKPKYIRGYPSAIFLVAHFILENHLSIWRPKAVFTTAERLHQKHRDMIERVFECKIFDGYGCHDGGGHAFECNHHSGLHLSDERVVSEVIPDSPSDPYCGEILFTDLHNYIMPFIRYRPGDKVRLSTNKCSCGRELTLIEDVMGRSSDILLFKNCNSLSMPAITLIFREFSFLQYQLRQISETELLLNLVYAEKTSNDEVLKLESILQKHLGKDVKIKHTKVAFIPLTKAGKTKICISDLPENKV